MDIAKEIEVSSQTRKRRTPTKRQKRDVIGVDINRDKENDSDTDEEASVRQQLDFAIEKMAAIAEGHQ